MLISDWSSDVCSSDLIDHLVRLGVTALELMPVQAFIDDRHLVQKGLSNYWGYNTIGFFAPAMRYISPQGDLHEFKLMVRRLHEAGIQVMLDVSYNHTPEGSHLGPNLPFRSANHALYFILARHPLYEIRRATCWARVDLSVVISA